MGMWSAGQTSLPHAWAPLVVRVLTSLPPCQSSKSSNPRAQRWLGRTQVPALALAPRKFLGLQGVPTRSTGLGRFSVGSCSVYPAEAQLLLPEKRV